MNPSEEIDKQIAELGGWRREVMTHLRATINAADPSLKEDWKWGTPVWTSQGNVVGIAAFKEHVKVNFFKGATLDDPEGLFNAGLDAKTTRSIDIHEGESVNDDALQSLVCAGVAANRKK
jgi:hypothetical protein